MSWHDDCSAGCTDESSLGRASGSTRSQQNRNAPTTVGNDYAGRWAECHSCGPSTSAVKRTNLPAAPCAHESFPASQISQPSRAGMRSEEHTSELQSPDHLVCRLLLEKKKKKNKTQA